MSFLCRAKSLQLQFTGNVAPPAGRAGVASHPERKHLTSSPAARIEQEGVLSLKSSPC